MTIDKATERDLVRFKRYRDELIHADPNDVEHHLREFMRELSRNELVRSIRASLPEFDADAWWTENVSSRTDRGGFLSTLDFPEDEDERLLILLDLAESMASGDRRQISIAGFGQLLRRFKAVDASAAAINLVFRPLAELLGDRIRNHLEVANPAVRELAGVPLGLIPAEGETLIFLSHKSADKALVRPYYDLLTELGLEPWLDEKDIKAGDSIHREIADGFDRACAVVFFITKNFKDERWLKREVDHAVNRQVEREERFTIITLVFDGAEVPRPLAERRWVEVDNPVDAVREILHALPIQVGPARWRK